MLDTNQDHAGRDPRSTIGHALRQLAGADVETLQDMLESPDNWNYVMQHLPADVREQIAVRVFPGANVDDACFALILLHAMVRTHPDDARAVMVKNQWDKWFLPARHVI